MKKIANILVDIQNDFIDGTLPVENAKKIIEPINNLIANGNFTIASFDMHPAKHVSFIENGGEWPLHCVENTNGSKLHSKINKDLIDEFIYKGTNLNIDNYSAFEGKNNFGKELNEILKSKGITDLLICGLALDVCVRATIEDALNYGYKVSVHKETVKAVLERNNSKVFNELIKKGVKVI